MDQQEKGKSTEQAGAIVGVGKTYVSDAKTLKEQSSEDAAFMRWLLFIV
jgi:hypothetical protein